MTDQQLAIGVWTENIPERARVTRELTPAIRKALGLGTLGVDESRFLSWMATNSGIPNVPEAGDTIQKRVGEFWAEFGKVYPSGDQMIADLKAVAVAQEKSRNERLKAAAAKDETRVKDTNTFKPEHPEDKAESHNTVKPGQPASDVIKLAVFTRRHVSLVRQALKLPADGSKDETIVAASDQDFHALVQIIYEDTGPQQSPFRFQPGMSAKCNACESQYKNQTPPVDPVYPFEQWSREGDLWTCPKGHRRTDAIIRLVRQRPQSAAENLVQKAATYAKLPIALVRQAAGLPEDGGKDTTYIGDFEVLVAKTRDLNERNEAVDDDAYGDADDRSGLSDEDFDAAKAAARQIAQDDDQPPAGHVMGQLDPEDGFGDYSRTLQNTLEKLKPGASSNLQMALFKAATGFETFRAAWEAEEPEGLLIGKLQQFQRPQQRGNGHSEQPKPPVETKQPEKEEKPVADAPIAPNQYDAEMGEVINDNPTALQPVPAPLPPPKPRPVGVPFWQSEKWIVDPGTLAKWVVESKAYPGINTVNQALQVFFIGIEAGIGPMAALQHIGLGANGKPIVAVQLKLALVRRRGARLEILESTPAKARVRLTRPDGQSYEATWTMEDANRAGLSAAYKSGAPSMYQKYPKQMLLARAWGDVINQGASDYIIEGGLPTYTIEEMGDPQAIEALIVP